MSTDICIISMVYQYLTLDFCTTVVVCTGMCHVKAVFMIEAPCWRVRSLWRHFGTGLHTVWHV